MNKTAIIFPGQGAQSVGMGKDVAEAFPAARDTFSRAEQILGMPLSSLCFEGPADRLNATDVSQPAIFVTSVAIWHAMEATGISGKLHGESMAGLSLGEYTALHLAGSLGFEDALRLVAERGRLMQAAAEALPGGMVSIIGLEDAAIDALCREAGQGDVLGAANYNSPGQVVISGSRAACERAMGLVEKFGGRGVPLTVAGAFHSALMTSAARGLEAALKKSPVRPCEIAVVSNVSADYHAEPDQIRSLLQEQVAKPTRWAASIQRLIADGYSRFVEVGPGRVLTGLMRKIDRSVQTLNYSTASSLREMPS